ncbi:sensor domain-containing diguanylate cyclase [Acidisoma sp. 7E03]
MAGLSALALLLLFAGCVSVLVEGRRELERRADMMAANILVLADETVRIEINRYDTRLIDLRSALEKNPRSTAVADLFGGPAARDTLGDFVVTDKAGRALASSRPEVTASYAALLPELLAQEQAGLRGLGISTITVEGQGRPQLALIRRCEGAGCGEAGAVIALMPMGWIQSVFDAINLGRNGAIGLLDSKGLLLARKPMVSSKLGTRLSYGSALKGLPRGTIVVRQHQSRVDGVLRRISSGWVDGLPLVVTVGISTSDIFQHWNALALIIIAAILLLSVALLTLAAFLSRQLHRKMLVDKQLLAANARLAELARTDPLTGLLNRRGFDENLGREWRRCRRAGRPISLIMLDADAFKPYNDHFGHQAGDQVLRAIAECILSCIRRPGDIAARYGGEEFAVVLPDTGRTGGMQVAEAIRTAIEALDISHAPGRSRMTVSVGLAYAEPGPDGSADALLTVADAALYDSKANGRNRVSARAFTPEPEATAEGAAL